MTRICKVNGEKCFNKMDCIDCYIFEGFEGKEMTNQAKAMRKGNNIKDLTSSNVVLVKPSQDCQAIGCCCCCTKFDLWKNILEILDGDEDCFDFGRYTTAPSRKDMVILRSLIIKRLNKR